MTVTGAPPVSTATVNGLTNATAYTFRVTASNVAGTGAESIASASVTPSGPPNAPTGVAATPLGGSATIAWTAPANNGSTITSYRVTPFIGTTAQAVTTVAGTATTATVTGLTNGTAYTFTVIAVNARGSSLPSAASAAVTPYVPAFIQQNSSRSTSASSISLAPTTNVTAGNRLVVLVGVRAGGTTAAQNVTDSAGNTYTRVAQTRASDSTEMSVWTAPIVNGGGSRPTITATPNGTAALGVQVLEYSGLSTVTGAGAVDQFRVATGTTLAAATVSTGATAATTAANELAIGFYLDRGFNRTLTAGSGFTLRANASPSTGMQMFSEDQLPALGATPNAGVGTGSLTTWLMATVVFKHK